MPNKLQKAVGILALTTLTPLFSGCVGTPMNVNVTHTAHSYDATCKKITTIIDRQTSNVTKIEEPTDIRACLNPNYDRYPYRYDFNLSVKGECLAMDRWDVRGLGFENTLDAYDPMTINELTQRTQTSLVSYTVNQQHCY
ncbi:MAG: hypothetical protein JKY11_05685 [Alphaproteobacteria bacterium]|nr:hypothetical protein [Alphaproteobacteria bacterium]